MKQVMMLINQEHKIKGNPNTWKDNMMMKKQRLDFLTKIVFTNISEKNLICCDFLAIICCGFGPKE